MGFSVVIVVNGENADIVTAGRERDVVAIFFAGGEWEVAEGLLLLEMEMEGLGDHAGGAAREVIVGQPGDIVGVGGRSVATAINVEASVVRVGKRGRRKEEGREGEQEEDEEGHGWRVFGQ